MLQEIKKVFSKDYQDDVNFLQFKALMRPFVKLRNESESLDSKIDRLKQRGYSSNCHVEVGDFNETRNI